MIRARSEEPNERDDVADVRLGLLAFETFKSLLSPRLFVRGVVSPLATQSCPDEGVKSYESEVKMISLQVVMRVDEQ